MQILVEYLPIVLCCSDPSATPKWVHPFLSILTLYMLSFKCPHPFPMFQIRLLLKLFPNPHLPSLFLWFSLTFLPMHGDDSQKIIWLHFEDYEETSTTPKFKPLKFSFWFNAVNIVHVTCMNFLSVLIPYLPYSKSVNSPSVFSFTYYHIYFHEYS